MALVKNISLIKKNSKTFYLDSAFLPHKIKKKVLEVYAFCRLYDDNVDLHLDNNLDSLQEKISHLNLNKQVLDQIKIGIDSDRNFKRYNNIDELSDKIKFYSINKELRKKIAYAGKKKYFKLFNETKITKFFIDVSIGNKASLL